MGDCCPGTLGAVPPDGADGFDPVDPDFWPQEGATARKRSNPAVKEQAVNRLKGRFIGRFMACLTGRETFSSCSSIRPPITNMIDNFAPARWELGRPL